MLKKLNFLNKIQIVLNKIQKFKIKSTIHNCIKNDQIEILIQQNKYLKPIFTFRNLNLI